jgi:hypothetical protein
MIYAPGLMLLQFKYWSTYEIYLQLKLYTEQSVWLILQIVYLASSCLQVI